MLTSTLIIFRWPLFSGNQNKENPTKLSLSGVPVLTRSNPATDKCSLHQFLDSLLIPSAHSLSSPS